MKLVAEIALSAIAVVALALWTASATGHRILPRGPQETLDHWLAALGGAEIDRGWGYLSPEAEASIYGGDFGAYLRDVNRVDWSAVAWSKTYGFSDDGFFSAHADLLSDPRTLPRFIVERRLVGPRCADERPMGIQTYFQLGLWREPRLQLAYQTGSAERCFQSFGQVEGPVLPPADFVSYAWATPGPGIRVGVKDTTGSIVEVGAGRESPPIHGDPSLGDVEGRVAVGWFGTACDEPARIEIERQDGGITLLLRTVASNKPCMSASVAYEVMLTFSGGISAEDITPTRESVELD